MFLSGPTICLLLLLETFVVLSAGALGLMAGYRLSRWQSPLPSRSEVAEAIAPRKQPTPPEPDTEPPLPSMYAISPNDDPRGFQGAAP